MLTTSSPLPYKGGHHHHNGNNNNNNTSFRSRDPEVSFTTFRGESPCSFRFDSDNDTLTRGHRQGNPRASPLPLSSSHHLQPHARSLHSVVGAASPAVFRPLPAYGVDSASSDEANSLGRRGTGAARRAITPGADISRCGYVPAFSFSSSTANHEQYGGVGGGGHYGNGGLDLDDKAGRTFSGTSTFTSAPPASGEGAYPGYGSNTVPPIEFRGRNNLGMPSARRQVPDYVNAYSDLDSGDDTRLGGDLEPTEDDYLLPPYPEFEAVEEVEEGEGEVSERSALNFVPGVTNTSRGSDDSYRARRSSEV